MSPPSSAQQSVRFGLFALDPARGELRKQGRKIRLQDQPFQVLELLLSRPGELVTREELQQALWPADTFVEFDQGLNTAIKKIRLALGDAADNPRFIQTIPRKGYRFIAPVERIGIEANAVEAQPKSVDGNPASPSVAAPVKRRNAGVLARTLFGVVTVALVVLAIVYFRDLPSSSQPALRTIPLTTYPGSQLDPAFSPDGKQVAFAWNGEKEDNFDIYVKLLDADTPLRLTSNPAPDDYPIWSPDGRYITFCRGGFADHYEIRMVPALGGAERKLAESVGCPCDWSADGRYIALADKNPSSIFLLSVETGEKRKLTSPPTQSRDTGDWDPRFSPDGKTLAFRRYFSFFSDDIYVLPLSSDGRAQSEPRRLTPSQQMIRSFDWTADGRTIVYPSDETSIANLLAIPASGGAPERLAVADANIRSLSIARTGRRLVYQRDVFDHNIWRIPGPNASDRTSAPSRFIASTQWDGEAEFSPDGTKIVFTSSRSGTNEIWTSDAEGRNPMQLTSFGPDLGSPRWSPDSRWIVFDSNKSGNNDIYVISRDGGQPRRLTEGRSDNWRPSWSRDGKWVYFGSTRSGDHQIWKIPAQGGAPVQVTKAHGGDQALESFDGKFIYYGKVDSPGIWKVPVGGGEETRVIDGGGQGIWSLTSRGIYYFDVSKSAGPTLKFYDVATGGMTVFRRFSKDTRVDPDAIALNVSPDGRWILYTQLDQGGSNLMLVENYH